MLVARKNDGEIFMKRFKYPIQKIFIGLLALGFVFVLVYPSFVSAEKPEVSTDDGLECGLTSLMGCIYYGIYLVGYGIAYVASIIINVGGWLLKVFLEMNSDVLQSKFVLSGFSISLSIANLGFVLAIIIMAFGTILRLEGYSMKQMLKNLVIAAVLVNFSLGIAGVFIDFTGTLSEFFIEKATNGSNDNFAVSLAGAFNLSAIQNPNKSGNVEGALTNVARVIVAIGGVFFTAIFSVIILITIWGIAVTILIRYLYLSILLVLMPLAWLCWTIPQLKSNFSDWWHAFIKWNFYLPTALFFLYLAILTVKQIAASAATGAGIDSGGLVTGTMGNYAQMIVAVAMAAGGLIVANKMGIKSAEGAMKAATGVKNWVGGTAKGVSLGTAKYVGQRPAQATARGVSKVLTSRPLRWIPGAKTAANKLSGLGQRQATVLKQQEADYSKLTDAQFEKELTRSLPAGPVRKAALLAEATKRKKTSKIASDKLVELATAAKQTNPGTKASDIPAIKEILLATPSLAAKLTAKKDSDGTYTDEDGKTGKTAGEIISKFAAKVSSDAFKLNTDTEFNASHRDPDIAANAAAVVTGLTKTALSSIDRNDDRNGTKIKTIKTSLNHIAGNLGTFAKDIARQREKIRSTNANDQDLPDMKQQLAYIISEKDRIYNSLDVNNEADRQKQAAYDRLEFLEQKIGTDPF